MKQIEKLLEKTKLPHWLIIFVLLMLLLRVPSFFEPYSYGDEMIYLTLGQGIRQGIPLYKGLHDNKPPLIYILAGFAGSLFGFKVILALWSLVTICLFWKLAKTLFPSGGRLVQLSTIIFGLSTTLPLLEGNIVNSELFMIGLTILAFLIIFTKKQDPKTLLFSGFVFGIGTLFKVPAAFDMPIIIFYWLIQSGLKKEELKEVILKSFYLILGFILPIGITFIWYGLAGALKEYFAAAFMQNVGYLSSFRPGDMQKPFLVRNFPLLFRGFVVLGGILIMFLRRNKLSKEFIFITLWLLFTLFAVTLSERPYPHYLIQSIAPISLLFAMLFTLQSIEQVLVILPLTLALAIPVFYKFWYYPTFSYYLRFLKFTTRQISKEEYFSQFDGNVNRNYKIAEFLTNSTKENERVFVWGDSTPVYALSRRLPPIKYVADYHISDFSSKNAILTALSASLPKFIVILPKSKSFPEIMPFLSKNYLIVNTVEGAEIWDRLVVKVKR
ncbi:glycosyltransferase family 39 protein [Candidatus Woesebacteria bacterium]|nr:glycosyltransferase family 39 protein [Candidatus Woesebacteria bacterium]